MRFLALLALLCGVAAVLFAPTHGTQVLARLRVAEGSAVGLAIDTHRQTLRDAVAKESLRYGGDGVFDACEAFGEKVRAIVEAHWKDFIVEQEIDTAVNKLKYAFVGFGSMARGEMSVFSDTEFAIITDDESLEPMRELLFAKVPVPAKNNAEHPRVILFVGYGNEKTKWGLAKLGAIPDTMANPSKVVGDNRQLRLMTRDFFATATTVGGYIAPGVPGQVRSTVLSHFRMFGDESVYATFHSTMKKALDNRVRRDLALRTARDDVIEKKLFDPDHEYRTVKEENTIKPFFNVKKAMMRPYHFLVEALALYYLDDPLASPGMRTRLAAIPDKKLHAQTKVRIKNAYTAALRLRIMAHFQAGKEADYLSFAKIKSMEPALPMASGDHALIPQLVDLKRKFNAGMKDWLTKKKEKHAIWRDSKAFKSDICPGTAPICE